MNIQLSGKTIAGKTKSSKTNVCYSQHSTFLFRGTQNTKSVKTIVFF